MVENKLTVIDLFSGAGGLSLAAKNLGMDTLAAVEHDKNSCSTYTNNFICNEKKAPKLYQSDILKLTPETILKEIQLEQGDLDLLVGGPPCQGFSSHRLKDQGVDDPRNKLLIRYFDFVKVFLPKVFLVENVPGLLWKRHELYLSRFMKFAKDSGYHVCEPEIVNARDYGIPQNRKRVFILGIREDINSVNLSWPPQHTHFAPKEGKTPWVAASSVFEKPPESVLFQLREILGDEVVAKLPFGESLKPLSEDPCAINMGHSEELIKRFKDTPINGSREDTPHTLKCHQNDYKGHKDVYGRVKFHIPSSTITTGCNNPSKGRFLHPWKNHGIAIRHAARLQTFPEDFIFHGGSMSQARQVGNAVPVKLGEVMINACMEVINNAYCRSGNNKKSA